MSVLAQLSALALEGPEEVTRVVGQGFEILGTAMEAMADRIQKLEDMLNSSAAGPS